MKSVKIKEFAERARAVIGKGMEVVGDITGRESLETLGRVISKKEAQEPSEEVSALAQEFRARMMEFELEFAKQDVEDLRLQVQSIEGARSREIDFMREHGGKRDWLMGAVVIVSLLTYILVLAFLASSSGVPDEKRDLFNMAVGQVFTFAGMSFSYYLGTTKSSRMKDSAIQLYQKMR